MRWCEETVLFLDGDSLLRWTNLPMPLFLLRRFTHMPTMVLVASPSGSLRGKYSSSERGWPGFCVDICHKGQS